MSAFEKMDDGVIWRGDGETLYVQAWGDNSFRVRSVMVGELEDNDYSLLPPAESTVTVEINDGHGGVPKGNDRESEDEGIISSHAVVTNGKITARLDAASLWIESHEYTTHRCLLSISNSKGEVLLREEDKGGSLNRRGREFIPCGGKDYSLTMSFESIPDEKLFGMGQYQQAFFDLKGTTLELAQRNSQASVPFVLSSAGYGFLWHNPAIGTATFAKNRTVWTARSTRQLDYWVTVGDTPAEILAAHADATGHTPTMPEYGLGYWQCKLRYWNQEQLLEVAREHGRKGIPLDVIVADFFHWPFMGDFRFEEEFWPDPRAMVDELKEMGVELMVSVWPQISHKSENFDYLKSRNMTVKTENGLDIQMAFQGPSSFADWTNPAAREYLWTIIKKNYYDLGIKVFWLDEAEPEYGVYDYQNYRYHQGTDLEIGNIYPQAYARAFYEGQVGEGQEEVVNLLRCAWSGSQRFGALVWSGDISSEWKTLRNQIVAGLHMGIAGIPWFTTDIGGFYGGNIYDEDFHELLVRWFQFGTFCPVMRMHGNREPFEPVSTKNGEPRLRSGAENEIWSFGPDVEGILTKYIELREKMRPYMRKTMDDVRDNGGAVMRALFVGFPDDPNVWDISDEYMLGDDLLIAPVIEPGAASRAVYLPKGASWRSLSDQTTYEGGQRITVDAPIDVIPVFARDGALTELSI